MKHTVLIISILILIGGPAFGSHHTDLPMPGFLFEYEGRLAAIAGIGDLTLLTEVKGRINGDDLELGYRSLQTGLYYRVLRNLKIGMFYSLQAGVRHDDDWIEGDSGWMWIDSTGRWEHSFLFDVTPRVLLPFLPGRNWVLAVKTRYAYNTYNGQQTLFMRPGLTYHLISRREPLLSISVQYGMYMPLNFGETPFYEHEPYLNILYHLNRTVKIEASAAYRSVTWSTSADAAADGEHYQITAASLKTSLGVILKLDR